jgi:hypothetical protein
VTVTAQLPPPPAPVYVHVVAQRRTNGFAIASLVLGIVWLYGIGSVLAVIFGAVALNQIGRSNGTQGGKGMAVAGLVLGIVFLAVAVLFVLGSASG